MAKTGERRTTMTKQQERLVHNIKKIILVASLALMLLVTVVVFFQTRPSGLSNLRPNPYKPEDFVIQDGYMTCLAGESWLGVDVSHHQGSIRWDEVVDSGIRFAMIRLGHRAVSDGVIRLDTYWEENFTGARNAGLPIGVYFYSQAISVEEAREEAAFVLDVLKGQRLEFPVVFDWEIYSENGRNANLDPETVNACAIAFCEEIAKAGYEPMVYFNLDLANRFWDLETFQQKGYPFWLAMYRSTMNWPYEAQMWQYTETGRVDGIDTPVDLNLYFP
jgi:GH25 family lysozyme M1 (1,4-beta-N-acetylmuramidase)